MPISHEYKAVFVHIPKTGGQSISAMLGIQKGNPNHFYYEGLTHLPISMMEEHIQDRYVFTFIRNPYDKIISEYNWRMLNRSSVVYNEPTRQFLTFDQYMELLLQRWDNLVPAWRERAHVMPQHTFIDDRVDIYRHEDFTNECDRLKAILGVHKPTPHVNKGNYNTQHTNRTIEITNELYKEDFERFGYDYLT